ncbi:MAG TPA: hypothetical protein VK783_11125 [Bacteroidia bacterium]|jgi:hypothetical protein|nr:hypothetical protein [Bacteroidia bacterium]
MLKGYTTDGAYDYYGNTMEAFPEYSEDSTVLPEQEVENGLNAIARIIEYSDVLISGERITFKK